MTRSSFPGRCCLALVLGSMSLSGCGVMVGSLVDRTMAAGLYPFQEWVFWGTFKHDNPWKEEWSEHPLPGRALALARQKVLIYE